jgi:hypothetical protein
LACCYKRLHQLQKLRILECRDAVDVRPFWPLDDRNPLQRIVTIEHSQWGYVAAGVAGLVVLAIAKRRA